MGTRRMGMAVLAAAAMCLAALPVQAEEAGPGSAVDGFLSGKLPPLEDDPAADPALTGEDPPEDVPFVPWYDWAQGQRIRSLRRIAVDFSLGPVFPVGGDAWESAFITGTAVSLEGGYAFAPFLTVSGGFLNGTLSGGSTYTNIDGTDYELDFSSLSFTMFTVTARLKLPFFLSFPEMMRFRKAQAGTGVVAYLELGTGLARLGSARAVRTWEVTAGTTTSDTKEFLATTTNLALTYGFGFQIRWSWGGVSLDFTWRELGTPNVVWGKSYFDGPPGGALSALEIGFGAGVYF